MTCMEAQALITPFINDKLDITTLDRFVDHVEHCTECKEELEVYFAILTAMKQLDEDEEVSSNFAKELNQKLKESQELVVRKRLNHIRKNILFFGLVLIIGLFTSVSVSVVEEVITISKELQCNRYVLQHEVLAPYLDSSLLNNMKTYQEIQEDLERIREEDKERKAQIEEEQKRYLEEQERKRQEESANNAKAAMAEDYQYSNPYSREYEQATDEDKLKYEKKMKQEKKQKVPVDSPMEYSR